MKNVAEVQDNLKMDIGTAREKRNFDRDKQKTATFTSDVEEKSNVYKTKCPLKDGDHKILELFTLQEDDSSREVETQVNLNCFCCLNAGLRAS